MPSLQGIQARGVSVLWYDGALAVPQWAKTRIGVLPFHPIWPGFAVNTVCYAAVLWLLIPGPFVLRRFIRMKRGRCMKCGYPIAESAVCTECGNALPVRHGVA